MLLSPVLILLACGGPDVASLSVPEVLIRHQPGRVSLGATALDGAGQPLPEVAVRAIASSDPAVAKIGKDGSVLCEGLGSATVTLEADGLRQDAEVRCWLVSAVKPSETELSLEAGGVQGRALVWQVLGLSGEPVTGVPVALTLADPSVVTVRGGELFGLTPGRTLMTGAVGEISAQVVVRVGEPAIKHAALPVPADGVSLPLGPGEWALTISAQDDVAVDVFHGRCSATDAGTLHHLVCRPQEPVQLKITPTGLFADPTTAHVRGLFFPGS